MSISEQLIAHLSNALHQSSRRDTAELCTHVLTLASPKSGEQLAQSFYSSPASSASSQSRPVTTQSTTPDAEFRYRDVKLVGGLVQLLDIELCVETKTLLTELNTSLQHLSSEHRFDYFLRDADAAGANPDLIVFDMDSTLIPIEVIDELAQCAGQKAAVSAVTEAAMHGQLDFSESLRQRVSLLEGLSEQAIQKVKGELTVNPGIAELATLAAENHCKLAIASGGFQPFATALQQEFGFWRVAANQLETVNGRLTGRVTGTIIDGAEKESLLRAWCEELGLMTSQCVAMGDGANDLAMLDASGLGVAYHAKPQVAAATQARVEHCSADVLAAVFHWL